MTNEEMERAMEFLVKNQASFDARLEQTNQQIAETGMQLRAYAETQSQFIEIVTESMKGLAKAQARTERRLAESSADLSAQIAESNARCDEKIAESNARLNEKIAETNARLDRLAATVERNITGGNGAS
jgi:hypothetical protein